MNDLDSTTVRKIGRAIVEPTGQVLEVWRDCHGIPHAFRLEWRPGVGPVTEYESHFVVHTPPAFYDPPGDNQVRVLAEHDDGTWFRNTKTHQMERMIENDVPFARSKMVAGLAFLLLGVSGCLLLTWMMIKGIGLMWVIFIILAGAAWLGFELWG